MTFSVMLIASLLAFLGACNLTQGFHVPSNGSVTCENALGMEKGTIPDSHITASSMWDSYHSPSAAKLGITRVGQYRDAWSAKTNDQGQWIQVDLGQVTKVTRIATQGREDDDQWVTWYAVQFSLTGYFVNYNQGREMRGNSDRNGIVVNVLDPAIIARYIRIRPKSWYGHISMSFEVYGCKTGFKLPTLPPCENKFALSGSQMSASSEWNHFRFHVAANGRLHHQAGGGTTGAWSARYNNFDQWLQVDLRNISKVTRVTTQGRPDTNEWVKRYTIEYSLFGSNFVLFKVDGFTQWFTGNEDRYTEKSHKFSKPIIARYIRILPKSWNDYISMRVALYGCSLDTDLPAPNCGLPLGLQSYAISDSQITASSEWDGALHRAGNARLHFHDSKRRRIGAWSARYNNVNQWLQVDFLTVAKITKIATQGRQDADQWVTSYSISFSKDGVFWKDHPDVFSGNSDRGTVVSHELQGEIYARFLRIHPRAWQGHISLRAEVYGCTSYNITQKNAPCDSNPCGNNGECSNIKSSFACACSRNFTGQTCQVVIGSGIVGILLRGDLNKLQQWNPLRFKESLAEKLNKYCSDCDERHFRTTRDTEKKRNFNFTANDIIIVGKPITRPSEGFLFVEFAVIKTINGKTHLINPVKVRQAIMKGSRDGIAGYDVITHKKSVLYLQNRTPSKSKSFDGFKIGFVVVLVLMMVTIIVAVAIYITQRRRMRPLSNPPYSQKVINMKSNQEKETNSDESLFPLQAESTKLMVEDVKQPC